MVDTNLRLIQAAKTKLSGAITRLVGKDYAVDRSDKAAVAALLNETTKDYCTLEHLRKELGERIVNFENVVARIDDDDDDKKDEAKGKFDTAMEEFLEVDSTAQDNLIVLAATERSLTQVLNGFEVPTEDKEDATNPATDGEETTEVKEEQSPKIEPAGARTMDAKEEKPHKTELVGALDLTSSPPPKPGDPPARTTAAPAPLVTRLPRQELPVFDGSGEWRQFWARFKVTIDSQAITETEKLVYLIGALRGDPLELVRGYAISDSAYAHVVQTLSDEYGDKNLQVTRLHSAFHNIRKAKETTASAHKVVQEMHRTTRQLTALGESIDFGFMETVMHKKLPSFLLKQVLREKTKRGASFNVSAQLNYLAEEVNLLRRMEEVEGAKEDTDVHVDVVKDERTKTGSGRSQKREIYPCRFCREPHYMVNCPLALTQRLKETSSKNLCTNCLKPDHRLVDCPTRRPCRHCTSMDHHPALCSKAPPPSTKPSWNNAITNTIDTSDSEIILLTHEIKVVNPQRGTEEWTHVFLDNGAQRSFISEELAVKLGLAPLDKTLMQITAFGNQRKSFHSYGYVVKLRQKDGGFFDLRVNSTPHMEMQMSSVAPKDHDKSRPSRQQVVPGILIGSDRFWDAIISKGDVLRSGLQCIKTIFGKMATGPTVMASVQAQRLDRKTAKESEENQQLTAQLKEYFSLEAVGVTDDPHQGDEEVTQEHFDRTVGRSADGRYVTRLPYKTELPNVAENLLLCRGRLASVWKRLKETNRLEEYDKIIRQQLQDNILEEVTDVKAHSGVLSYLPHHPVINDSKKSTKLRIVFDASAGPRGRSLNKNLYQGDVMMPHAPAMLIRMRSKKIVVTADIQKAFLQVGLHEDDRDALRLLWLKNPLLPPSEENTIVLRFTRVPFGVICSPFLLSATIRKHLQEDNSPIAKEVVNNLYADNLLIGAETAEEAREKIEFTKEIFQRALMPLREWTCNNGALHKEYSDEPEEDRTTFLGIGWDVVKDTIIIKTFSPNGKLLTKRNVLAATMSTFDPLGLLAPALLPARRFMQKISSHEWDRTLEENEQVEWLAIESELADREVTLDRRTPVSEAELHVFTDASGCIGYGAAVYLRTRKEDGAHETFLVMAKSKVCPSSEVTAMEKDQARSTEKRITVPRLELLAAELGAKLANYVRKELALPITKTTLWTDSLPALSQIVQPEKEHQKFVANRVEKIHQQEIDIFRYVPTYDNPADVASRGCTIDELKANVLWWKGPRWLRSEESEWPSTPHGYSPREPEEKSTEDNEEIIAAVVVKENEEKPQYTSFLNMHRQSTYMRLEGKTGYVIRFCRRLAARAGIPVVSEFLQPHSEERESEILTAAERFHAARVLIRESNKEHPPTEDTIRNFGLRHDGTTWRAFGRLVNTPHVRTSGCPYFVDPRTRLAWLVTDKSHTDRHHCGEKDTVAHLRRTFWIPRAARLTHKVLRDCQMCKLIKPKKFELPHMPPLPDKRVTPSRPFSHVGVDYLGPVTVTSSRGRKKVWVSLWTCMATRALHLEIVGDLSTASFLLAFRRFIARRGRPDTIISDHGTNFVGAEKSLAAAWELVIDDKEVLNYASKEKIEWRMITPRAPWKGGFYERLVQMVKKAYTRTIGGRTLTSAELHTVVVEIEALLNSRPLVQVSDDGRVLCPNDFLCPLGHVGVPPRPSDYSYGTSDLKFVFFTMTEAVDDFWQEWQNHYLPSLREVQRMHHRHPRSRHGRAPKVGEVVIVVDNQQPRGSWKLAVVVQLIVSADGAVRAAMVRLPNRRVVERAVNHLLPLEITEESKERPSAEEHQQEIAPGNLPETEEPQQSEATGGTAQPRRRTRNARKRRAPDINEAPSHSYNLRSSAKGAFVMMALLTLIVPTEGRQCVNNTKPAQGSLEYADHCKADGGIIVYRQGEELCYIQKACRKGQHLRYSASRLSCGDPCSCPSWSSGCSHYRGDGTTNSSTTVTEVQELIERLRPREICSLDPSDECAATPRKKWFNKIQLYDGSTHPITDLHLQYRNPTELICMGGDGFSVTGTALFCARNTCVVNATTFCTHNAHETIHLKGDMEEVLIEAWGGELVQFYPHKSPSVVPLSGAATCSLGGVTVKSEGTPRLLEVCSTNHCDRTEKPSETEEIVLPHAITVAAYNAKITLYSEAAEPFVLEISCPAGQFCEQIGCVACWEMLANPHCAPRTLIIAVGVGLYFASSILAIFAHLCIVCMGMHRLAAAAWRVISALMRWCWRRRPGSRAARQPIAGTPRRPMRTTVRNLRWTVLSLCILALMNGVGACDRTSTIVAAETVCTRKEGVTTCRVQETIQWPSISPGERVCLQITDNAKRPMATVEVDVEEIQLECKKVHKFFTYSYRPAVASTKRCPGMGSCAGTKCADFKQEDWIPEMGESQSHPGTTYCSETCGCLGCGCFFCSAACLFYRPHAVIDHSRRFEVFTCSSWKQVVKMSVTKTQPERAQQYNLTLAMGQVEEMEDLRLHLTKIATPPLPMLTTTFVTDGKSTAIVDDVTPLQCLQCGVAGNCTYRSDCCSCTTYDELARCSCTSGVSVEQRLSEATLPQRWQNEWFLLEDERVVVRSNDSLLELQATLDQWSLTPVEELSTCLMRSINVTGCHSCRRGATVDYICEANTQHALGHVYCDGGVSFNVECSMEPQLRSTSLSFDRSRLDVHCDFRCGIASEPFTLRADLALVSLVGEAFIDARQAIPVILTNIIDLSLSSYEYMLVIIVVFCILFFLYPPRTRHIVKRE